MKNWYAYSMNGCAQACAALSGILAMNENYVAAVLYGAVGAYGGIRAMVSYRRPE